LLGVQRMEALRTIEAREGVPARGALSLLWSIAAEKLVAGAVSMPRRGQL